MTNPHTIHNRWLAIGLFLITVLTRLPFAGQYLYHWDSVNLAFGLRQFDVQAGAPQYPGYIIYVLLGQLINTFIQNEQNTLVLISIISSGLATIAVYYLGQALFHPTTGLLAAFFLITSPLVWFYGEVALPHTLDLFGITFALWLLWRIMNGERRWLWFTAVFLALLGGIRQQDLLFLGPVIVFALWPVGFTQLLLFVIIGAVVSLVWFVPLVQNAGGLQPYLMGSSAYSSAFFSSTSLLHGAGTAGLRRNIISKLAPYTLYAWSLALLPAIIYWGTQIPRRWRAWLKNRKVWFVLLSMAPALAFYAFIHMGQQGLVFVYLPVLLILSAEGLRRLLPRPAHLWLAAAAIGLVGAAIFVLAPAQPFGASGPRLLTYSTIREHDRQTEAQISGIRAMFKPENTVLLAVNWRHMEYYLPEYPLARVDMGGRWEADEGELSASDFHRLSTALFAGGIEQEWHVVIPDADLQPFVDAPLDFMSADGSPPVAYVTLGANDILAYTGGMFRVEEENAQT